MTETKFRSYFLNMSAIISDSGIRVNPITHVGGLQVADIKISKRMFISDG